MYYSGVKKKAFFCSSRGCKNAKYCLVKKQKNEYHLKNIIPIMKFGGGCNMFLMQELRTAA